MKSELFNIDPKKVVKQKETGRTGVEADFVRIVKLLGWKTYKFTSEMNRGVSDRIVFTPGAVWFVEVKQKTGKLTALQESFRDTCRRFKLNHFVVYGKEGINDFIKEATNNE